MTIAFASLSILPLMMALAAVTDLTSFRIPNFVSIILVAGFAVFALVTGMSLADVSIHAGTGLAMLVVCFAMFCLGWVGGGDAKLVPAAALWVGPADLPMLLVAIALAGGVLAIGLLLFRRMPMPPVVLRTGWLAQLYAPDDKKRNVPYAVAIAAGTYWALPHLAILADTIV